MAFDTIEHSDEKEIDRMVVELREIVAAKGDTPVRTPRLGPKPDKAPLDLYFIQSLCPEGRIKIGVSSRIASRMGKMMVDCPYPVRLLKSVKDAAHMEKPLHREFSDDRVTGEWFRPSPRLLALIERL